MEKERLDLLTFSEILSGGRKRVIEGFWGIEKGLMFKKFLSMPYTIPTNQILSIHILNRLKKTYFRGEISLYNEPQEYNLKLLSPLLIKGKFKYHRERRRLIRRAEEQIKKIDLSKDDVRDIINLCKYTAKKHGRKPIRNLAKVLKLPGVDVIKVYKEELVGVIVNLRLEDRYLLWQMGWKDFNFLPTYLLHLSVEYALSLGYDKVDFGITRSSKALKVKKELGCIDSFVYVCSW